MRCDAIGPRTKVIHDKQSCSMLLGCCFLNTIFMEEVDEVCKFVSLVFMLLFSLLHISPQRKALSVSLCWRISVVDSTQSPTFVVLFGGRAMRFNAKVKCCYNNKFLSLSLLAHAVAEKWKFISLQSGASHRCSSMCRLHGRLFFCARSLSIRARQTTGKFSILTTTTTMLLMKTREMRMAATTTIFEPNDSMKSE